MVGSLHQGEFYRQYGATWTTVRRVYFGTYIAVSLASAGLLLGQGFICPSETDLVCVAPSCSAAQAKCEPLKGPCHQHWTL